MDIDSFYAPDAPAQPSFHGRGRLISKFTTPASPPMSPPYNYEGAATPRSMVTMDFPYPPSSAPPAANNRSESPSRLSIRSARSFRSIRGRSQHHIASATTKRGDDAMNGDAISIVDEGDFDEAEERRLMPMYMRQSELRKGNSRKALKWLGLA